MSTSPALPGADGVIIDVSPNDGLITNGSTSSALPGTDGLITDVSAGPDEGGRHLLELVPDEVPLLFRLERQQRHAPLPIRMYVFHVY